MLLEIVLTTIMHCWIEMGEKMLKNKTYRGHTFGIVVGIAVLVLMLAGGAGQDVNVRIRRK